MGAVSLMDSSPTEANLLPGGFVKEAGDFPDPGSYMSGASPPSRRSHFLRECKLRHTAGLSSWVILAGTKPKVSRGGRHGVR